MFIEIDNEDLNVRSVAPRLAVFYNLTSFGSNIEELEENAEIIEIDHNGNERNVVPLDEVKGPLYRAAMNMIENKIAAYAEEEE